MLLRSRSARRPGRIASVGAQARQLHAPLLRAGAAREIAPAEIRRARKRAGRLDRRLRLHQPAGCLERGDETARKRGRPALERLQAAPSPPDAAATLGRRFSKDTRQKLRRRRKALTRDRAWRTVPRARPAPPTLLDTLWA